jgi:hypothetical protein
MKTPCVCRDGSASEGRAGVIMNGGTSSLAEITLEPFCNVYTYVPEDGSHMTSTLCRPFTPLSK